jgi:hypothetical protein
VSPGHDVFGVELGWPSVTLGYTHGLSDYTDAGFKFDLLYGFETTTNTEFGIGFRVPLRAIVLRKDKIAVQLHFDPGLKIYPHSGGNSAFGLGIPIGGTFGVQVNPEFRIAVGADLPMTIFLTPSAQFVIGTQFGFAAEYLVDRTLLVGINTRFGPVFNTSSNNSEFGFITQVGIGYRM